MNDQYFAGHLEEYHEIMNGVPDGDFKSEVENSVESQASGYFWQEVADAGLNEDSPELKQEYWLKRVDDLYAYWAATFVDNPGMIDLAQ